MMSHSYIAKGAMMKQVVGSILVAIGNIWVAISSCGIVIVAIFLWLGIVFWGYSWGGLFFVILWLFLGTGIVGLIVGVTSLPVRLFGAGMIILGEELKNSKPNVVDARGPNDCIECGRARVSEDDQYCRGCGQQYD